MYHRWSWIAFIHWHSPPSLLQSMLPSRLAVETFDGSAWVGLTPLHMQGPCASATGRTVVVELSRDQRSDVPTTCEAVREFGSCRWTREKALTCDDAGERVGDPGPSGARPAADPDAERARHFRWRCYWQRHNPSPS
ncbi:DUF2071 domain-containing protein [Micromonospora sp. H33]|uniref:DUF2071 domain-containing protein n=1 Tax=Micromonospora sp. H33 TaxID=3452215 RepID=UPI003F88E576